MTRIKHVFAIGFVTAVLLAGAAASADSLDFELELVDGSSFNSAEHRGQWLVVNFWATWCTPCLKEIPDLSALHDSHDDIVVVGLAWEDIELADMHAFLESTPASYPVAIIDVYDPPPQFTAPRGLPLTLIVNPAGEIAERFLGPVTRVSLERAIDALREG